MPDDPLDAVLIGGRESVAIVVVDYDATWPERFEEVRDRVATALGPVALDVRHIGSTSVPGLAAKPIVDVLLTVPDVEDEPTYLPPLEAVGLVLCVASPGIGCCAPRPGTCTCTCSRPTTPRSPTTWTCGTGCAGARRTARCTPRPSGRWRSGRGRT